MKKYLKYYLSDSQYDISSETPCVSYCAQEDELHYSNIPNLKETVEDLLQQYNVQNINDLIFDVYNNSGNVGLFGAWNSFGILINQFEIIPLGYNTTDLQYENIYNFEYNRIIADKNVISAASINKVLSRNLLKQLDGKAKIRFHYSGD